MLSFSHPLIQYSTIGLQSSMHLNLALLMKNFVMIFFNENLKNEKKIDAKISFEGDMQQLF